MQNIALGGRDNLCPIRTGFRPLIRSVYLKNDSLLGGFAEPATIVVSAYFKRKSSYLLIDSCLKRSGMTGHLGYAKPSNI